MGLDARIPRERELGDDAAAVGVEDLAGQPDRAEGPIRAAVPDAKPPDLDRHDRVRRGSELSADAAHNVGEEVGLPGRVQGWVTKAKELTAE